MKRVKRLTSLVVGGLLAALASTGCSPLGPTSPPAGLPGAELVVENFSGALPKNGMAFYSFAVLGGGTTRLTLLSLKEGGADSPALVTIGIGVPRGTGCVAPDVLSVAPGGYSQVSGPTDRGIHCALVSDPGNLTTDATFSLNISRPK